MSDSSDFGNSSTFWLMVQGKTSTNCTGVLPKEGSAMPVSTRDSLIFGEEFLRTRSSASASQPNLLSFRPSRELSSSKTSTFGRASPRGDQPGLGGVGLGSRWLAARACG